MINCLIVDDEALARKLLADYVNKIPELNLVGSCENPIQAKQALLDKQVDLLLLDIQMPEITGVEFIKTLKDKPLTIFTTAYAEYALEGYELDIIDYLLKPISFERFFQAIAKAQDYLNYKNKANEISNHKPTESKETEQGYIFLKADYKIIKLYYNDILFIEGLKEYVKIHTQEKNIITYISLQKLTELLPENRFIRIHKSYIVNIEKIDSIENTVVVVNKEVIGIGRSYKNVFFNRINRRLLN